MKEQFYKTNEEKLLKGAVDYMFNDEIGCNENAFLDGDDFHAWGEEELIDYIVWSTLVARSPLRIEESWMCLEPRHIRFIGGTRVREIVEHRVKYRHQTEGPWLWEKKGAR